MGGVAQHPGDQNQPEALLFDLGGVVFGIDFERTFAVWAERAGAEVATVRDRFKMDRAYELHERGEIDEREYFAALRSSLGLDLSDEDLRAGWRNLYLDPLPGIEEVLRAAAAQLRLFAFTNSNPSHRAVWGARFSRELVYFKEVFVSSDLGLRKPELAAFGRVADLIGLLPARILFFDDTEANVSGARAAGMAAVHVTSISDVREALRAVGLQV